MSAHSACGGPADEVLNEVSLTESRELTCGHCEDSLLHQLTVRVYARREDAAGTLVTVACQSGVVSSQPRRANQFPRGGRRDHVEIDFGCESCGALTTLVVQQHKGTTSCWWACAGHWTERDAARFGASDGEDLEP